MLVYVLIAKMYDNIDLILCYISHVIFLGSTKEGETSPLSTSERKDSLSLQVEFVKVNISRSRKINLAYIDFVSNCPKSNRTFDSGGALIRFSGNLDHFYF